MHHPPSPTEAGKPHCSFFITDYRTKKRYHEEDLLQLSSGMDIGWCVLKNELGRQAEQLKTQEKEQKQRTNKLFGQISRTPLRHIKRPGSSRVASGRQEAPESQLKQNGKHHASG